MKIRELLAGYRSWTKHASARDINNRLVDFNDNNAVSWCLTGAAQKCYPNTLSRGEIYSKINAYLENKYGRYVTITYWNDNNSYEQVKEMVDSLNI